MLLKLSNEAENTLFGNISAINAQRINFISAKILQRHHWGHVSSVQPKLEPNVAIAALKKSAKYVPRSNF